ncbi:hypothetical protein EGN72_06700 [Pseudorhodobacter sp. E13]|uniref:hypothetical protein n=1 Tax=Pseudorhodobacter sp. E13 TaxID=2487931 RepID=UPI000F8EBF1D|nr:hypothetical protein [Pseudorhodobacter sp. E13]RUS60867.1 hypothetical protein EGN72_06700 [Pseudorhodobacter sp. E13]
MTNAFRLIGLAAVIAALSGAAALAQDNGRSPSEKKVLKGIIFLPYEKHIATLGRLGVQPTEAFYNCLCKSAGYGAIGTSQFYHPGTLGEYDPRYSCNQPGDPCVVSGYGCFRNPLPTTQSIWDSCAITNPLGSGNSVLEEMLGAISARSGLEKRKLNEDFQRCKARHAELSKEQNLRDRFRGYDYLAASGVPVLPPPKRLAEAQKAQADRFILDAGNRLRQAEVEIQKALDQSAMKQLLSALVSDPNHQQEFFSTMKELTDLAHATEAMNVSRAESIYNTAAKKARADGTPDSYAIARDAHNAHSAARARLASHDAMARNIDRLGKIIGGVQDVKAFSDALGATKGGGSKEAIVLLTTTMDMTQKYVEMATSGHVDDLAALTQKMEKLDPTFRMPQGLNLDNHAQLERLRKKTQNSKFVVDTLKKGVEVGNAVKEVYDQYTLYESKVAAARTRMASGRYSEAQQDLLFAMSIMSGLAKKGGDFLPAGLGDIATYFSEALMIPEMADTAMRKAVDTQDNFAQIAGSQKGSEAMQNWVNMNGNDLMLDDYLYRQAKLSAYVEDNAGKDPFVFLSGGTLHGATRLGYDKVAEMAYLFPIVYGRRMTDEDLLDVFGKYDRLEKIDLNPMREQAQLALSKAAETGRIADLMGKKTITPEEERAYRSFSLEVLKALPFGCAMDPELESSLFAGWMKGKEDQAKITTWLKDYGADLNSLKSQEQ